MLTIVESLFTTLFNLLADAIDIILTPINAVVDNLFPNMATAISNFTTMCNTFFTSGFNWLLSFVPSLTKSMLLLWLTFEITYYGVIWTYTIFIKVYNLIQKIKFW